MLPTIFTVEDDADTCRAKNIFAERVENAAADMVDRTDKIVDGVGCTAPCIIETDAIGKIVIAEEDDDLVPTSLKYSRKILFELPVLRFGFRERVQKDGLIACCPSDPMQCNQFERLVRDTS